MRSRLLVPLLAVCLVGFGAACSSGPSGSSDASGIAGSSGGNGPAGAGGGQAGSAAGGRGGGGGQAGAAAGTGGQAGNTAGNGGAGGRGGAGGGDVCPLIAGMTFRSVTEHECGRGGLMCRWSIAFMTSTFDWTYSDIGESGTYTCSGAMVTGHGAGSRTIAGQYDAASQTLTWDGVAYTPQ